MSNNQKSVEQREQDARNFVEQHPIPEKGSELAQMMDLSDDELDAVQNDVQKVAQHIRDGKVSRTEADNEIFDVMNADPRLQAAE